MLFRAEAVVRPVFPVVVRFNFRKWFTVSFLSFSEDGQPTVGFQQKYAFFADDECLVRSGFDGWQPEGCERGEEGVIVVVEDEFFASESSASWVSDCADVVG